MTTFDDRESAFEAAFVHGEELLFRAKGRGTKLLAEWAGRQMKKAGPDLAAYRERMLGIAISEGDEALIRCLHEDLDAAGQVVSCPALQRKLDALRADAAAAAQKA